MKHRILHTLALTILAFAARGQGCSDAGVCTAGPIGELALHTDSTGGSDEPRHLARALFSYAVGERSTTITQGLFELGFGIGERWGVQARVPYQWADGDLGKASGMGDPVITASYDVIQRSDRKLTAVAGAKLPANEANAQVNGAALPMPYQTSLGTTDLLLGLNHRRGRWNMALAGQVVLVQGNRNLFTHAAWMDDMAALGYPETVYLERASDAVARLQYTLPFDRLALQPGLLAIVHLGQDTRLDYEETLLHVADAEREPIDGSEGLTLNLTLDARYRLTDRWAVEVSAGAPMVTRAVRPDGLTRSMVLNTGLSYRFGR